MAEAKQDLEEVTPIGSQFVRYAMAGSAKARLADVEAKRIILKIGTLAVDLSAIGQGTVTLDGKPVSCRALSIRCTAGEMPQVQLEILPF